MTTKRNSRALKHAVKDFWNEAACGEVYAVGTTRDEQWQSQAEARYALEPFIVQFAEFATAHNKSVLEVGVGMGADHLRFARSFPETLIGIDLTARAARITAARLNDEALAPRVNVADAEHLPFRDSTFDLVFSWGVIHHSPDTPRAVDEIMRVLRPGGTAKIMIYNRHSIVGLSLWIRYALLRLNFQLSLDDVYASYLESPGTKAYTRKQAEKLFGDFSSVSITYELSPGDLLNGAAGQRHAGSILNFARRFWPRRLIRGFARRLGLFMLIKATK